MKRRWLAILLLVCCAVLLLAETPKPMPMIVAKARFVMVTTFYGTSPANPRISSKDRQAVADVENAIQKWNHYQLVYRRHDADILLVLRRGSIGRATAGIGIGRDSQGKRSVEPITAAEAGPPDDTMWVYDASLGTDSAPLWMASMKNGLLPPELKLFQEFRKAVETALKKQK